MRSNVRFPDFLIFVVRALLFAASSLFVYRVGVGLIDPHTPAIGPDVSFGLFTISMVPVMAGVIVLFGVCETGFGLRPSIIGYAVSSTVMAYAGISAYFYSFYDVAPSSLGALEGLFLISIAIGGALFGAAGRGVRRINK